MRSAIAKSVPVGVGVPGLPIAIGARSTIRLPARYSVSRRSLRSIDDPQGGGAEREHVGGIQPRVPLGRTGSSTSTQRYAVLDHERPRDQEGRRRPARTGAIGCTTIRAGAERRGAARA